MPRLEPPGQHVLPPLLPSTASCSLGTVWPCPALQVQPLQAVAHHHTELLLETVTARPVPACFCKLPLPAAAHHSTNNRRQYLPSCNKEQLPGLAHMHTWSRAACCGSPQNQLQMTYCSAATKNGCQELLITHSWNRAACCGSPQHQLQTVTSATSQADDLALQPALSTCTHGNSRQ
jgi:hypothetical protein